MTFSIQIPQIWVNTISVTIVKKPIIKTAKFLNTEMTSSAEFPLKPIQTINPFLWRKREQTRILTKFRLASFGSRFGSGTSSWRPRPSPSSSAPYADTTVFHTPSTPSKHLGLGEALRPSKLDIWHAVRSHDQPRPRTVMWAFFDVLQPPCGSDDTVSSSCRWLRHRPWDGEKKCTSRMKKAPVDRWDGDPQLIEEFTKVFLYVGC